MCTHVHYTGRDCSVNDSRLTTIPASEKIPPMNCIFMFLAGALFAEPATKVSTLTGKVVSVANGDTLTVLDADNVQHKIRLHGIDAPEKGQPFGAKAKEALAEKVHEKTVRVVWIEKDRYGRIVGDVYLDHQNINVD